MTRAGLEKYQVLIYLAAIVCGLVLGGHFPALGGWLSTLLWPALGLLLYATFTQIPLERLPAVFSDSRFFLASVLGNFLLVPLLVYGLVSLLPDEPALRLGVFLVLLLPCTDWFLSFTHLGGGDTRRAAAFTPISLFLQLLLLPVYLWLFLGADQVVSLAGGRMMWAFGGLVLLPLLLAGLTRGAFRGQQAGERLLSGLAWWPVPLLALVVFMVAASQVTLVAGSLALLGLLAVVFLAYLLLAPLLALGLARCFKLPPSQGRTLAFSLGSRNSLVVLPIALGLPASLELAVVVIVFQSLVELFGMLAYLHWVPARLFPGKGVSVGPD